MDSGSSDPTPASGRKISRADIDEWSTYIRQARARAEHLHRDAGGSIGRADMESELELTFEELNVAEAELRAQYEQLASTQLQLERERSRYRDLFEYAPVPYLVTSPEGAITDANIAAATLLGPDADRLRGKPLQSFIPLGARPRFRQTLAEMVGAHVVPELVFVVSTRHGLRRIVNATVNVVRDFAGKVTEVRWLLFERSSSTTHEFQGQVRASTVERLVSARTAELERQVVERERMRRQAEDARCVAEQSSHDAAELLATVSHELRTPISAIVGYIELLSMGIHGPLLAAQETDVERMRVTLDHVVGLLDNLLLYFRAGGGTLPIELQDVSVEMAVHAVAPLLQPMLDAKQIHLDVVAPEDVVLARADADRLRQILLNLIGNAAKFTESGGAIQVRWSASEDDVELLVRDNGVGIPANQLERIFRPFVQVETPHPNVGSGFGLGLAISRGLARAMGGDLVATSESGSGSTFELRLPRAK